MEGGVPRVTGGRVCRGRCPGEGDVLEKGTTTETDLTRKRSIDVPRSEVNLR